MQERASRAVEVPPGKEQRRRGSSAEPPSSSPEECGWQEDVWQLTCFARARTGCRARGWQESGGAAPKGAVLLELDERGADQPLEQLRIASRVNAGGAELLASGIAGGHNHRLRWCPHRVGYCLRVPQRAVT